MTGLLDKVRTGALTPLIHQRMGFEQAPKALSLVAGRKIVGKCLLLSERGLTGEP
jgi:NADPH:quinone reductase-like Zn-dependent oxidoreductase